MEKAMSQKEERKITSLREETIINNLKIDKYDYATYLRIHELLFNGIYPFAGTIRKCWLRKGYTDFLDPSKIKKRLSMLLEEMNKISNNINNHDDYITFISNYFYEINMIHPFEEGNGRTERVYFRKYVNHLNSKINFGKYEFNYNKLDEESKSAFRAAIMYKSMNMYDELYYNLFEEIINNSTCKVKTR